MVVESLPLFRIQSFERVFVFFFHCVSVQLFWIVVLLGFLATFHPLFEGRRFLNFDEGRCSWSVRDRGLSIKAVHMSPWFSPMFFYLFQSGCFCFVALFYSKGWNHNHFHLSVGRSWCHVMRWDSDPQRCISTCASYKDWYLDSTQTWTHSTDSLMVGGGRRSRSWAFALRKEGWCATLSLPQFWNSKLIKK